MSKAILGVILPMLVSGLKLTLVIAVLGIVFGFLIGSVTGYVLQSRLKILKLIGEIYIWIIRGTPLVVQALYTYFVIPKLFNIDITQVTAGIIVISLNSGAFIAEIVKGALLSIDPGQREAGLSLGLTPTQTLFHIIVPPAFRMMIPALCNQFIIVVKDTALLTVINVGEITYKAMAYAALSYQTVSAYTVLALFYLLILSVLMVLQKYIERRMSLGVKK